MRLVPSQATTDMPLKDADPSTPALFKWAAVLEGVTLLVLLGIAVPLKHLAGVPNGVSWVCLLYTSPSPRDS